MGVVEIMGQALTLMDRAAAYTALAHKLNVEKRDATEAEVDSFAVADDKARAAEQDAIKRAKARQANV